MNIPDELVAAIASGNAVLFVGAGLSVGAGLPSWKQLIDPLAERLSLPDNQRGDLLKIAQFYETQRGRHALISYIKEQIDATNSAPTENHRRLTQLGIRTWLTTNFDDLLEQTLRNAGERVTKVVRDYDLPYAGAERLTLIKLHGDSAQPETIVITGQDYNTYARRFPRVKEKLSGLLVDKTFLFIGYSISDPDFNQLLDDVAFDLQQHQRMAYAVLFDVNAFILDDLRARSIQVLNISPDAQTDRSEQLGALLDALVGKVEQARQPAPPVASLPSVAQSAGARGGTVPLQDEYAYDAFISYNQHDREWVETTLQPQLERAGLRLCLPDRDFAIGAPWIINME
ncbi:MAG: toll/interleukin-1 receptor domain-containing protein, partial [Roseiflexaceae bacterium]